MFTKSVFVALVAGVLGVTAAYDPAHMPAKTDANGGQTGYNDCQQRYGATNPKAKCQNIFINSVKDFCLWGPPKTSGSDTVGDLEAVMVSYCMKSGYGTRLIPDGTIHGAHFLKTPSFVQITGTGDFTKIHIQAGDEGGELDPHGATNMGNPVGGNVTSNVSGQDVFYEEWMNYISYNQVCFRICIAGSEQAPTALECQHELDVMGCNFVMPGNYADNVFETCDGDAAYPPGLYPEGNGQTSTFQQYFTGEYVVAGTTYSYTNGAADQTTPTGAYSTPSTSNCQTTASISNGIRSLVSSSSAASSSSSASASGSMATSARGSSTAAGAAATGASSSGSSGSSSSGSSGSSGSTSGASSSLVTSAFGIFASVAAVAAGAYLL